MSEQRWQGLCPGCGKVKPLTAVNRRIRAHRYNRASCSGVGADPDPATVIPAPEGPAQGPVPTERAATSTPAPAPAATGQDTGLTPGQWAFVIGLGAAIVGGLLWVVIAYHAQADEQGVGGLRYLFWPALVLGGIATVIFASPGFRANGEGLGCALTSAGVALLLLFLILLGVLDVLVS